jgi:hypothetical protein
VSSATGRGRLIYAENAGLVAVKRHWLAVAREILTRGFKISKCRLCTGEQNVHQSTGRIINLDQCGARRRSIFKPSVLAAINLYQLAHAGSTLPRLVNPWYSKLPWHP